MQVSAYTLRQLASFRAQRSNGDIHPVHKSTYQAVNCRSPKRICLTTGRAYEEEFSSLEEAILEDEDTKEEYEYSPSSSMRPWTFLIPSLNEVATNKEWHLKVSTCCSI